MCQKPDHKGGLRNREAALRYGRASGHELRKNLIDFDDDSR